MAGKNVYVVWADEVLGNEILYKKSTNAGSTFGSTINISNIPEGVTPSIASTGNNVYIVWSTDIQGNTEIFYKISKNGGSTFESTINLSNNEAFSTDPAIAISKPQ